MGTQRWYKGANGASRQSLTLALASVLVVFATAELVVRLAFPVQNLPEVIQFDPDHGWALRPGAVESKRYEIRINSLGMRDAEMSPEKPAGTRRILHIGDSIAFGLGVDVQWRFSDFLDRALGEDVEVINAAVPGWGTDQEVLHFESIAQQLRPDIVVLNFTMMNDVINNGMDHCFLQSAPKPRFTMDNGALVLVDAVPDFPAPTKPLYKRVLGQSAFLVFVKNRLRHMRRPIADPKPAFPPGFGHDAGAEPLNHWSVFEIDRKPEVEQAWRTTEALIVRLNDACRRIGAELIVFPFPVVEVDDDWRRWLIESTGIDEDRYDFHGPFERLEAFCARERIDYVYPLDEFREASETRKLIFEQDGHPNRQGHALAARVLLGHLNTIHDLAYVVPESDRPYLYPAQ